MSFKTFAGPYSVTTTYSIGDFVTYQGNLYQASLSSLAIAPSNNTAWTLVSTGFTWKNNWSANTTYNIGQIVLYSNIPYLSLDTNIGKQPNISTNDWRVFNKDYKNIVTNQPGDVQYQGNTTPIRLPIGNNGQVLTVANSGLPQWANAFTLSSDLNVANSITTIYLNTSNVTTISLNTSSVISNSIVSNKIVSNTFNYSNGESPGYTYSLDDISSQFDGINKSFVLSYNNGTTVAPNNPNQLQISIGNVPVFPTNKLNDYQNLTEIAVFKSGYYVTGNTINFATAPSTGMSFYGTYKTNQDSMPSFSFTQLPMSALNIMLGS